MAFTGAAVFQLLSNSIVRVTGLSLGAGATGTIGLAGGAASDVVLPASFQPNQYSMPDGSQVDVNESVDVQTQPTSTGGIIVAVPVEVAKVGATPALFQASLTNPTAAATNDLEIYVRFNQ